VVVGTAAPAASQVMVPAITAVTDVDTSAQRPSAEESVLAVVRAEWRTDASVLALRPCTAIPKGGLFLGCARTAPQHHIPRR